MATIRFKRPAALCAAVAALIMAFAFGEVRAQPVTPPIQQPPPTFNPSTPNVVPQPPPASVAPSLPASPSGPSAVPNMPAIVPPPTAKPQPVTTPAPEKAAVSHARHHVRVHRHRRHSRYRARVLGPAYYPGVGEFYPPYPNVCHMSETWYGYYAPYWAYSCGW